MNTPVRATVLVFFCLFAVGLDAAEPPAIERVNPPGMQRGTACDVKLVGKPGDGPLRVWSDLNQLKFEFTESFDGAKVTAPSDATPGIHWCRFYNDHGATDLRAFFVGVIPESAETEPNNDITTAHAIDQPSLLINGVLDKAGEVDVYRVTVPAGRTLVASMQANTLLGSPMDAVLQVLDSQGTVVAQNDDDHAMDPQIALDVADAGTYFVRTFAFPSKPNSTIRLAGGATYIYRLTITSEAFVDFAVPAVVNPSQENALRLHGWNLSDEQRSVTLAPFAGERRSWIAEGLANALPVAGEDLNCTMEDESSPQSLTIGGSLTGCISTPGEEDVYEFTGMKGQKLTISAVSRSLYSQLDPVIIIRDSAGKTLKEVDDRSRGDLDAEAAVVLRADGQHSVTVTDRFAAGGMRYFYVLRCVETRPAFTATLTSSRLRMADDKPVEIPVAVSRANGFSEELTVSVSDLPAGVTVEPVVSAAKGDTAKSVTLKLTRSAEAQAFAGPVHVECRAESGSVQRAVAAIPNSVEKTSDVWLTVVAPEPTAAESDADTPKE